MARLSGGSFVLIEIDKSQPQYEQLIEDIRRIILTNSLVRFVLLDLKYGKKDNFAEIFSPYNLMTIDQIGHLERCFLQANALFTLSDSVEVLEECAGFGTRGILLQSSTVRLDLVSSGWITLTSSVAEDLEKKFQTLLSEGKTMQAQVPLRTAEAASSGAARRIVAALTSRISENEQKWRTSLPP
ncbi:MAG: UDP-N-acetyl glucosamine 2-epimerase [Betaproteobacteria bacterium]|nr:UDP-N-acetyl glucosamine 2-epimerase [Betaproteobacteria bacterium]